MKILIIKDELRPCYYLEKPIKNYPPNADIPTELYDKYNRVFVEFLTIQGQLEEIYEKEG